LQEIFTEIFLLQRFLTLLQKLLEIFNTIASD